MAWWEDVTVFVAERRNPTVNGGRPTVKRIYIDPRSGELTIAQTWGRGKGFVATFALRA